MSKNNTTILKVLVGSRANGLHDENSDYDYRAVYVTPTQEILSLGHNYKGSTWLEGDKQDNTAWEIGHFLHLAIKCNPTTLEIFKAPIENTQSYKNSVLAKELIELFPHVWNPKNAFDAFVGYGLNQRKKMLDNHLDRWEKYAVAYLRTLWNLNDLLDNEDFSLEIKDESFKNHLIGIRNKERNVGEIINYANSLTESADLHLKKSKHEPDKDKVNEFLLKIRKNFW